MDKKTAIVVIHGIGQQETFETLDAFVRGFTQAYSGADKGRHELIKFPDWIESRVSVKPGSDKPLIDIYEYYWAHFTQEKVGGGDVISWLVKVAKGAKRFYSRAKTRGGNDDLFSKDGEFNSYKYLVRLLSFGNWIKYIFLFLVPLLRIKHPPFLNTAKNAAMKPLADCLGDVLIYTESDRKSQYFRVRKQILDGAVEKVKFLIESGQYSKIILAGHSLGSVIAYDVLDRLNKEMNVNGKLQGEVSKITGIVTFGSPLDKVAFFFDEHINQKKQAVRFSLVSQLHSFKRVNIDTITVASGINQYLDKTKWINFWAKTDPVSGNLDVYAGVDNIEMDFSSRIKGRGVLGSKKYLVSHSLYWDDPRMYERIIKEFDL